MTGGDALRGPDVDPVIRRLAARQHGVVTRAQLLDCRIRARAIDLRVETDRLIAVYRGMLVLHQTTRPFENRFVDGLPTTPTLRTLEDLGWPERLVREALARRLLRPDDLPKSREIAPTESELEERMRRLCRRARLPQPVFQHRIGPYRIDFAWLGQRVLVETDGYATHGDRRAFESDRSRDADLIALGYTVIRFTWRQLCRTPTLVAARLAAALALNAPA